MIPEMFRAGREPFQLSRGHWEVLTLEDSNNKLLAAETVRRDAFEQMLRNKLEHLVPPQSSGS